MTTVPLSILDLSPISAGSDAATALHNTIDLAQRAEQWGYRRFWIAEHHFVGVASSAPAVLIGQIAAATNTIHVGSAAVHAGDPDPKLMCASVLVCTGFPSSFGLSKYSPVNPDSLPSAAVVNGVSFTTSVRFGAPGA